MGTFYTALLWVNLLAILSDLGFSAALVQRRQVNERLFSAVFWTNFSFGCLLVLAVLLAKAHLAALGALLSSPSLADPFLAQTLGYLCLLIPFAAVSGIFRARLLRDLDFKGPALAEVVSVLTYALASLVLWPRYGIWALVIGSLIREIAMFVSLWVSAAWLPRFSYDFSELKQLFFFGANVSGERLIGAMNSRISQLLIYPLMGPVATGYYVFATQFSTTPLVRLSTVLQRVALPTMSTMQDEDRRLGRAFVKAVQSVALIFWPPLMLLLVFAAEIVIVVKQDFLEVVLTLQMLVLATVFKSVGAIVSSVFLAKGKSPLVFPLGLKQLSGFNPIDVCRRPPLQNHRSRRRGGLVEFDGVLCRHPGFGPPPDPL